MPTDGSTSDQELRPRRRVGQFELFTEIASGGMATVHLGRVIGAGDFARVVAIKRLHAHFAKDPIFTRMFLDEARVVARIRHPNVTPTIDLIEEEGELFIVMEYVEGETFAALLREARRRKERVPVGVGVRILTGALHGLHAAHEATSERGEPLNLVHRDVSPENIMVGTDGYPRLLDFGIARALGSFSQTREGEVKGKLAYMTPEQILGEPVTRRTDVFSASVVLWQALTGRQLFKGKHVGEYTHKILYKAVDPPSYVLPDLPKKYDAIVLKGLAREPEERWPSALAMAEALEAVGGMATQREVGVWVRRMASAPLAALARKVSAVENAPHGATPMSLPPVASAHAVLDGPELEAARGLVSGAAAAGKPRSYRRVRTSAPPSSSDEGTPSAPPAAPAEKRAAPMPGAPPTMPAAGSGPRASAIAPPPPVRRGKAAAPKAPPPPKTAQSLGMAPPPLSPLSMPAPPNYSPTPPGARSPSLPPPSRPPSLPPESRRPSLPPAADRPSVPPRPAPEASPPIQRPDAAHAPAAAASGPPRPAQRSAAERLAFPDAASADLARPPRPGTVEAGPPPVEPEPDDDRWDGDEDAAAAPLDDAGRAAAPSSDAAAMEPSAADVEPPPPEGAPTETTERPHSAPETDGTEGRKLAWGSAEGPPDPSQEPAAPTRADRAADRAKRARTLVAGAGAAALLTGLLAWGVRSAGGAADTAPGAGDDRGASPTVAASASSPTEPVADPPVDAAATTDGPGDAGATNDASVADHDDAAAPSSSATAAATGSSAAPRASGTRGKRPPSIYGRR